MKDRKIITTQGNAQTKSGGHMASRFKVV